MTEILNFYGRTGAGKSSLMKENVLRIKAKHLFVVPRRQSIEECFADLQRARADAKLSFEIVPFLRDDKQHYKTIIAQEISEKAGQFDQSAHCCLIITQAAFQKLALKEFEGWHLKLDELMTNGNMSNWLHSPIMYSGLANIFEIVPLTDEDRLRGFSAEFSRLKARPDVDAKYVFADCRLTEADRNLHQRALSPIAVYTDAKDWEDVRNRRCSWCSPWTFDLVDSFASIEVAACDIEHSLSHLLSPREYTKILCPSKVSEATIRIFYFDHGSATCSAAYWKEAQGRTNLILIAKELEKRGPIDYWTCNESGEQVMKPLMPKTSPARKMLGEALDEVDGTWITQQQDGSNRFRTCTSCAIIISSKAQDFEEVFERLNPLATRAAISKGREGGLIFQFVSRGSIRNQDFAGDYTIYLYDRQQAETLREKLIAYQFPNVEIEHIALAGFVERERPVRDPTSCYQSPQERSEAKRRQNAERQRRHRAKKLRLSDRAPTVHTSDSAHLT